MMFTSACFSGALFLNANALATEAAVAAIMDMENDPLTNAGYGSNLTEDGQVRGDAILVDHNGRSGAVGSIPCKNSMFLCRFTRIPC